MLYSATLEINLTYYMSEDMGKIVEKGWKDDAIESSDPKELIKNAVFEARRQIEATKHSFQNEDGTPEKPNEHWIKGHGSVEAAQVKINELLKVFEKEKELLFDALVYVEYEVLPNNNAPDIQYLNQVGGAFNYVMWKVLDRTSDTVESTAQLDSILRNFMGLFFHVSGWEYFAGKAERRLGKK
jgi:hypothetical protein